MRPRLHVLSASLLAVLVAACCARPAPSQPGPLPPAPVGDLGVEPANLEAQLTPYIESIGAGWGESGRFSGYVLVAQHDQPIYARAFGFADRAAQRAATAETTFRIGSVTKQFTAAAILALEQAGKLKVTDTVKQHLPDYPGPAKDVTIHQLLTHTGGIPNYTAFPEFEAKKAQPFTTRQLLETFWDRPLEFEPGSKHAYSNSGYAILGAIIEKASGKSYAAYVHDALFVPAGMTRTAADDKVGAPDRAEGYKAEGDALGPSDPIDVSIAFAAGAVRSSANDMVRWHRALSGDTILPTAARTRLYQPDKDDHAYGWVVADVSGRETVWHSGGIDGFRTTYWRVPDADLVVIVFGNNEGVNSDPIGRAAVEAAFGGKIEPEKPMAKVAVDAALTARVAGVYALTDESKATLETMGAPQELTDSILTVEVNATATGISAKPNGQDLINLVPVEGNAFFDPGSDIKLTFELPASGPATAIALTQGGLSLTYTRQ